MGSSPTALPLGLRPPRRGDSTAVVRVSTDSTTGLHVARNVPGRVDLSRLTTWRFSFHYNYYYFSSWLGRRAWPLLHRLGLETPSLARIFSPDRPDRPASFGGRGRRFQLQQFQREREGR